MGGAKGMPRVLAQGTFTNLLKLEGTFNHDISL